MSIKERLRQPMLLKRPYVWIPMIIVSCMVGLISFMSSDRNFFSALIMGPLGGFVYYCVLVACKFINDNTKINNHKSTPSYLSFIVFIICFIVSVKFFDPFEVYDIKGQSWIAIMPLGFWMFFTGFAYLMRDFKVFGKIKYLYVSSIIFGIIVMEFSLTSFTKNGFNIVNLAIGLGFSVIVLILGIIHTVKSKKVICSDITQIDKLFKMYLDDLFGKLPANDFYCELREQQCVCLYSYAQRLIDENKFTVEQVYWLSLNSLGNYSGLLKDKRKSKFMTF